MALLPLLVDDNLNINIIQDIVEPLLHPIPGFHLEGRDRELKNRNEEYFEVTIPTYTDTQFKEHFRMSKGTFEDLVHVIGNNLRENQDLYAPLRKKVLFTIWMLSKPESFLAAGDRFDFSSISGHHIFKEIVKALANVMPQYIRFPNERERKVSSNVFETRSHGLRGVVGAIDGCHIPCKQPIGNATDYYNRKGFHSIILQGTCDHRCRFTDVFIGMPGRMHDARVFKASPIYTRLQDPHRPLLKSNEHLIGDSAYPLSSHMMTPFRDTGHLTAAQTHYNVQLSSIRSVIERAFGLLKGKFRRLKYLDIADFELGNNMIGASCMLHNFIIDHNDVDLLCEYDIELNEVDDMDNEGEYDQPETVAGEEKRRNLMHMLR